MQPSNWVRVLCVAMILWSGQVLVAQEPLVPGETVMGLLDSDSVAYVFPGAAGDQVSISLRSRAFDPLVRILSSDGTEVAQNDDTDGSLNAAITGFILPLDDDYTVVVDSLDDQASGEFELQLAYSTIQTIDYGDVIEGEISEATPSAFYRFNGLAGDAISVRLESADFDAYLTLNNADGELTQDDDSGGNTNALIGGYALLEDDTYTIQARPLNEGQVGSYRLMLDRVTVTPLIADEAVNSEVTGGELYYSFEARTGDRISIRIDAAPDLDTELRVKGPAGYMLIVDDDGGLGLNPEVNNVTADFDGRYILSLYPLTPAASGPLAVTLHLVAPTDLAYGDSQSVAFGYKNNQHAFRFQANAGDTVRVTLTTPEVAVINLNVVQAGEQLNNAFADGSSNEIVVDTEIPADGEVRLLLGDYDYRGKTYNLLLERVENAANES